MRLLNLRPARPFSVADRTHVGDLYETMYPRLAAIRLLREHLAAGSAGLDPYDETRFLIDAAPHETVWVRRCLDLTGVRGIEGPRVDGTVRMAAFLEADVRLELGLDADRGDDEIRTNPMATRMGDEPLASRAADPSPAIAALDRAHQAWERVHGAETVYDREIL